MGCAPTAVIGPTQAVRPIGHHCWKEIYSAAVRMSSTSRTFFCSGALGTALRHHRRGVFSELSALSRVISLDLIDLDAHVGTRVRSVFGDRRVADGLDLRRGPAADSTCCKGNGRRASATRGRSARVRAPLRMSRLGRVPQLCGSQGYRAVSRPDLRCSSVMVCLATAMVGAPDESLLLQSAFAVDAGHERGEVVGGEKGRRWGRTPVEQALGALKCLRGPQLVVDDTVQVGVVLTEVAGRVLEVPEEVRPGVVPAQPPDVPLGMALEHRRGAAADLVDVVDLPGGVVQ